MYREGVGTCVVNRERRRVPFFVCVRVRRKQTLSTVIDGNDSYKMYDDNISDFH